MKQADNSLVFITNAQYRDHAAWYHFFIKLDTTQATSTDRLQLWVNGVRVTSWDAYPTITQNANDSGPDGDYTWYKWTSGSSGSFQTSLAGNVEVLVVDLFIVEYLYLYVFCRIIHKW